MNRPHEWTKIYDPHRGTYVMKHKGTGIKRPISGGLFIPSPVKLENKTRTYVKKSLPTQSRVSGDEILKRLSTLKL